MPTYNAGDAALRIVPDARELKSRLEADLKRINVEYAVKITADLARARADLDKFRAEQEGRAVKLRAEVDRDHMRSSLKAVGKDFEELGASLSKALKIDVAATGIALLPSLATGLAEVTQALQQLAQAGLAVPGILAGVGASVGTVALALGGVKEAWTAVDAVANQSGASQARAAEQATQATNALRNAKVDELNAQKDLAQAYKDARNSLEDLNIQQRGGVLSEQEAILGAAKARRDLATGRFKDALDYQEAQLRVEEADQRVVESRQHNLELNQKISDENAKGIAGSDKVVAANERLTRSHQAVAAAQASVADVGAGGPADKAAEAMAKLAPNAREFVQTMLDLKPAFLELRSTDAQNLFEGLGASLKKLVAADLPTLKSGIGGIATALNSDLKQLFGSLGSDSTKGFIDHILGNTANADARVKAGIDPLIRGFGQLAAVGSNSLPRLADAFDHVTDRFAKFIEAATGDGRLDKWINEGLTAFTHLGDIVLNLAESFGAVSKALGGQGLLADFDKVTKKLADFLNSAKGQQELTRFFAEGRDEFHKWEPVIVNLAKLLPAMFKAAHDAADEFLQVAKPITDFLVKHPGLVTEAVSAYLLWETTLKPIGAVAEAIKGVSKVVKLFIDDVNAVPAAMVKTTAAVNAAAVEQVAAEETVTASALEADAALAGGGAGPSRLGQLGRILGKSAGPIALGFLGVEGIKYAADSLSNHAGINPLAGPNPTQGIQTPIPPTGSNPLLPGPGQTPDWDATAQGESGGDWKKNTGNGYFGGLQFLPSSWALAGGLKYAPRADLASEEQQKAVANTLLAIQGPGAWPNTFKWKFGAATPPAGTDFTPPTDMPGHAAGGAMPSGRGPGPTGGFPIEAHGDEFMISSYGRSKQSDAFWNAANKGMLPHFEGGGDVQNVGQDQTPGPGGVGAPPNQALLGPPSIAPNPTGAGPGILTSALAGFTSGASGAIGQGIGLVSGLIQNAAAAQGGGGGGGGGASVPGVWGLLQAAGQQDPAQQGAALGAWGSQTAQWLGNFGAKTLSSAANIGLQGGLDAVGLGGSILSPTNPYNQAIQKTAGFYLGDQSPFRSGGGGSADLSGSGIGSQTIKLPTGETIQVPTFGTSGSATGGGGAPAAGLSSAGLLTLVPQQWAGVDAIATGQFGLTVGSRFRGADTAQVAGVPAAQSYHASGRATDYNGTPEQRLAFANFMAANYGSQLKELIYSAPGFNSTINNGKVVGPFGGFYTLAQAGDHSDHVHIAFAKGGPVPSLYDDGGLIPTGATLVQNNTSKPEQVFNQTQTKSIAQALTSTAAQINATPTGPTAAHQQPGAPTAASPILQPPSQPAPAAASPEAPRQATTGGAPLPGLAAPSIAPGPENLDHNLKAIDTGIDSAAKAIGQAASTAIGIAAMGAGAIAPGAGAIGAIGPYVAGLIMEGGKVAKDLVNVPSSFLVGDVPGSTGTQSLAYGSQLRAPQNFPNVANTTNVTNISGNYELRAAIEATELRQAQEAQAYTAHRPRTP